MSRGDFSDLPAAPADELCPDEAAAKSLTPQTSLTLGGPINHTPHCVGTLLIGCWGAVLDGRHILNELLVRIKKNPNPSAEKSEIKI